MHHAPDAVRRDLSEADEQRVVGVYKSLLAAHGPTPSALGMRPSTQGVRFGAVLAHLRDSPPASLIDIGCGFGDLLPVLRRSGWRGRYLGLDLMPEFVEVARHRYRSDGEASFLAGHVLECELAAKTFDGCVALGLCNNQREAGAMTFIEALIARGVALARRTVLIDFLSTTSDRRRDDLFFTEPADAVRFGLRYSRRIVLDHSYMPYEFMLRIHLDDQTLLGEPHFSERPSPSPDGRTQGAIWTGQQ